MLQRLGYTVIEASNGEEALELAGSYPQPLALLLTDLIMPGLNGVELARRIAEMRPDIRVLIMSGYAGDELERRGAEDLQLLAKLVRTHTHRPELPACKLAAVEAAACLPIKYRFARP